MTTSEQIIAVLDRASNITDGEQQALNDAYDAAYNENPAVWETAYATVMAADTVDDGSWREHWDAFDNEPRRERPYDAPELVGGLRRVQDNTRFVIAALRSSADAESRDLILGPWRTVIGDPLSVP
ncbi:hypothetical protein [Luteipulveratus mongoliensis]|uniref:hypothetical protein n=1 Tax=Luteipulveratus mongoliensis TaxID=571913 RepID=UPI0006972354|nr:hypothetical protein [Luteipulveratus mongoliensis]